MNFKQIIGLILVIAGVVGLFYAFDAMDQINTAKDNIKTMTKPFEYHPAGKMASDLLQGHAGQHDTRVMALRIGSIALVIIGAVLMIFCGKKRKR
jgi:hypothetical protein